MKHEFILVLDFGSQYNQLITRRVRELGVYSELHDNEISIDEIKKMNPKGIILSGGPNSVYEENSLTIDDEIFNLGIPVLGICYGMQLMQHKLGGRVESATSREYGAHNIDVVEGARLFEGTPTTQQVLMSHSDKVVELADGFKVVATSDNCPIAAAENVEKGFYCFQFIKVDAKERFLGKLKGVSDPEKKRKIIGNEFVYVFDEECAKLHDVPFLAQGTLYTDVIESGTKNAQTIKSHHNVGGLPEDMRFSLIEPLNTLFKDEVRALGEALGLPHEIVWRQPFPGPGLGIRVLGEVTEEKLQIVRDSDFILRDVIAKRGLEGEIWQYFTCLPDIRSVGVMGDVRTYDYTVAVRAVTSIDGMTASWAHIPFEVLEEISARIVNEVAHVNRVVYDITSKPPATIEWE